MIVVPGVLDLVAFSTANRCTLRREKF